MHRRDTVPKQTYYNLSAKKQKKIFDAAFKEFSQVPFNEASISNIIKEANIPRGSFYQYFENKEDLYFYIIEKVHEQKKNYIRDLLSKYSGDVFKAFEEMFLTDLELIDDENYHNFFKNLFLNLNVHFSNRLPHWRISHQKNVEGIMELIDQSKFKNHDFDDLWHVLHLMMLLSKELIIKKLSKGIPNEEVLEIYKRHIEIIKYGTLSHDNEKARNKLSE